MLRRTPLVIIRLRHSVSLRLHRRPIRRPHLLLRSRIRRRRSNGQQVEGLKTGRRRGLLSQDGLEVIKCEQAPNPGGLVDAGGDD